MTDDRRATLEAIAFGTDERISPGDRIRALELLDRMGGVDELSGSMLALVRQVQELSGPELDAELAGFFQPGSPPMPPSPDGGGEPMPVQIEKEVERRANRMFRSMIRRWAREKTAPDPERVAAEAARTDSQDEPATSNVVPLSAAEARRQKREDRRAHTEAVRRQEEFDAQMRAAGPPPPGVDPLVWWSYSQELNGV